MAGNIVGMVKRLDGEFFTISEVAKEVGRSVDTVRLWIRKGIVEGPTHVMPLGKVNVWLYTPEDIQRFRDHVHQSEHKSA